MAAALMSEQCVVTCTRYAQNSCMDGGGSHEAPPLAETYWQLTTAKESRVHFCGWVVAVDRFALTPVNGPTYVNGHH